MRRRKKKRKTRSKSSQLTTSTTPTYDFACLISHCMQHAPLKDALTLSPMDSFFAFRLNVISDGVGLKVPPMAHVNAVAYWTKKVMTMLFDAGSVLWWMIRLFGWLSMFV